MVFLRIKVNCHQCGLQVERTEARALDPMANRPEYECFSCFKRTQEWEIANSKGRKEKRELYCVICKYKFKSLTVRCPYCSRTDCLTNPNVSAADLL